MPRPAHPDGRVLLGPRFCGVAGSCLALLGLALIRYGLPLDVMTVLVLAGGACLVGLIRLGSSAHLRWGLALIPLLFHLHLHFPWESAYLQDVHGGRIGVRLFPDLRFGRAGPNTFLLERQLGPLNAEWRHRCTRSMLLGDWRDGNERVNSRSLIYHEDYPEILAMLPDEEARRQVSACLTDTGNLIRVHQGLLLACLKALGYPRGHDARTWWAAHQWAFVRISKPEEAAPFVHGWADSARRLGRAWNVGAHYEHHREIQDQIRAVEYQERGTWGGDPVMGQAHWNFQLLLAKQEAQRAAKETIVWWPHHRVPDE
ncbi:MAG: hypothetical protein KF878_04365 [Planctomycetes bacterium]|nr:hypothetical protein [Planctomycetota bacterium]